MKMNYSFDERYLIDMKQQVNVFRALHNGCKGSVNINYYTSTGEKINLLAIFGGNDNSPVLSIMHFGENPQHTINVRTVFTYIGEDVTIDCNKKLLKFCTTLANAYLSR